MGEATRERVFLVDGTALVYRAHFAFLRNPLLTSRGEMVSAVYGFTAALFQLLRQEKPAWMAVAFDLGAPTFRHEAFPGYKAHRPPMPPELETQLPRVKELVHALGLQVLEQEGVEADDLIGTLARRAQEAGREVVIVSADKDFMQLVSDGIRQWIPPASSGEGQWIDRGGVRTRWGVDPEQMVDLLALMGDASDNIPGVTGVGPKTAARLLERYGTLDGVYAHLQELGQQATRARLERDRGKAYLSQDLVRIRTDLPLPCELDELRVPIWSSRPQVAAVLRELEFRRLLESLDLADPSEWTASYVVVDTPAALETVLAEWRESRPPLALDTETTSLDARTARAVGFTLAWRPGHAFYLPVGHADGPNLPLKVVVDALRPILEDPLVTLVGQNLKYDLHVLAGVGLESRGPVRDTLLASYLIDPEGAHNLDALSQEYLHHRMIPITDLIGKGRDQITMDQVPVPRVAEYSGEDVDVTLRLSHLLEPRLKSLSLLDLWTDLECPLVRVLLRMEQAGVRVDAAWLSALSRTMESELERLSAEIHRAAEVEFNINSPAQLAHVLFTQLRLPAKRKTKTGLSTEAEVLEDLSELHPVPRLVLEHRSLSKLKGTYVDALPALIDPRTGRIHASFNQMVAATGRLSTSDPNLQNIPIRTPLGREIRKAFIAEEGHCLVSADYSQIELRILAHLSGDEGLREAFRNEIDVHAATAARIFGVEQSQVGPEMRARAKLVNFGVIYGMGPQRLARELSISVGEAKSFIDAYFSKMPGVSAYLKESLERARRDGYVTTLLGRRRLVRGLGGSDSRARSQAERIVGNTPIQGSAADLIKRAMLEVDRELARQGLRSRMILQVHDELVLETPEEEVSRVKTLLREAMEGAASLDVPLRVDVGVGDNWSEAH